MTFNGKHFYTSTGVRLGIVATLKRGRWSYRDEQRGILYASGVSPSEFARDFWGASLTN